jgi:hypothetical protein
VMWIVRPVFLGAVAILRSDFQKQLVAGMIDDSMKPIGLGMIVIAALG